MDQESGHQDSDSESWMLDLDRLTYVHPSVIEVIHDTCTNVHGTAMQAC